MSNTETKHTHLFYTVALVTDPEALSTMFDRILRRLYCAGDRRPHVTVRADQVAVLEGSFPVSTLANDYGNITFNLSMESVGSLDYVSGNDDNNSYVQVTMRFNQRVVKVSFPITSVITLSANEAIEHMWRQGELIYQCASTEPIHDVSEHYMFACSAHAYDVEEGRKDSTIVLTSDLLPVTMEQEDIDESMFMIQLKCPDPTVPSSFRMLAPTIEQGKELAGLPEGKVLEFNVSPREPSTTLPLQPNQSTAVPGTEKPAARVFDFASFRNGKK